MNQDSRGVQRGRCHDQTCGCDGYDGGSEGKKCVKCGHPPGKHENLDRDVTQSTGATSFQHGQNPSGDQSYSGYVHVPAPQLHINLPHCQANGCDKLVWYDYLLQQAFSYCSPECRDGHLLSDQKQKLKDDLEGLKVELQHVVAQEIGLRQTHQQTPPSPKQAATPPTGPSDGIRQTQQQSPSTGSSDGMGSGQTQQQSSPTGSSDGGGKTQQQSPPLSSPEQTPPPPTVVSDTSSSSSVATSSKKGKKPKQKSVKVAISKMCKEKSGLILSKKPYVTEDATVVGFIIVGVVRVGAAYKFCPDDKIRMCDVVQSVNDKPCQELNLPGKDLQNTFERHIEDRCSVSLLLSHCIALPPVSGAIAYAKKRDLFYTHVITLMHMKESDDHYGLTLNEEFVVEGVSKDSPANLSRIKFGDKICMYVTDSKEKDKLSKSHLVSEKPFQVVFDLEKAHRDGRNVILFVVRSNVSEV